MNDYLKHYGVLGMKWGRRRYRNSNGTLTTAGLNRHQREIAETGNNKIRSDPNRWVRQDLQRSKNAIDQTKQLSDNLSKLNKNSLKRSKEKNKMDLSNMTDKEMREAINRKLLERQYNDLFNEKNVSKGRTFASNVLEIAGDTLGVASSAVGIAVAIKTLKG